MSWCVWLPKKWYPFHPCSFHFDSMCWQRRRHLLLFTQMDSEQRRTTTGSAIPDICNVCCESSTAPETVGLDHTKIQFYDTSHQNLSYSSNCQSFIVMTQRTWDHDVWPFCFNSSKAVAMASCSQIFGFSAVCIAVASHVGFLGAFLPCTFRETQAVVLFSWPGLARASCTKSAGKHLSVQTLQMITSC